MHRALGQFSDESRRSTRSLRFGRGDADLKYRCHEWSKFMLPKDACREAVKQESILINLPREIQLLIFTSCTPNDRIALALSCKELLKLHTLEPLEVPRFNAHCAPWNASLKWKCNSSYLPACPCGGLEKLLLQCSPYLPGGRPARSRQLCVDCMKWLPRRASYWKEKADRFRNEFWDKNHDAEWTKATNLFSKNLKRQCPKCYFIEQDANHELISIWKDNERRTKFWDIEVRRKPRAILSST